jgi:hypothetical protein
VLAWISLSVFTAASVGANVRHGLEAGEPGSTVGQLGVVVVSALIPLGVLLTSECALDHRAAGQGTAEQRQALACIGDCSLLGAAGAQSKPSAAERQDAAAMVRAGSSQVAARKAMGAQRCLGKLCESVVVSHALVSACPLEPGAGTRFGRALERLCAATAEYG